MTTNIKEPSFSKLRNEAISSIHRLLTANNGVIEPEAVLHLGMFLSALDKQLSGGHRVNDTQQDYYDRAHNILNKFEEQSIEANDVRTVQMTGYELGTLRNTLEILHGEGGH
jgi:hypothetical protein